MAEPVYFPIINQHFSDVNPIQCGWEDCLPGHFYGPAARDHFLIHYIRSGRGFFLQGGRRYDLHSGMIVLIRPDVFTYYQADDSQPWSYIWIGFAGSRCGELIESSDLAGGCVLQDARLERIFGEIRADLPLQSSPELFLCAKIYELFAILHRQRDDVRSGQDYVRRAIDYIKANYTLAISIEGMAGQIGINRRYLSRIFAAETGMAPRDYLQDYRLQRAATYLIERGYTVQDVARSVGYADVFNFSKAFKKRFGLAPTQYRRRRV